MAVPHRLSMRKAAHRTIPHGRLVGFRSERFVDSSIWAKAPSLCFDGASDGARTRYLRRDRPKVDIIPHGIGLASNTDAIEALGSGPISPQRRPAGTTNGKFRAAETHHPERLNLSRLQNGSKMRDCRQDRTVGNRSRSRRKRFPFGGGPLQGPTRGDVRRPLGDSQHAAMSF